jgi:predicted GIY-YIG superfamily endonuclease
MSFQATVYLIHFDRAYHHARHYIGYTALETVEERIARHRSGRGARLLDVVTAAGISWRVVKTWEFPNVAAAKQKEKSLKGHSGTRYCPVCNP